MVVAVGIGRLMNSGFNLGGTQHMTNQVDDQDKISRDENNVSKMSTKNLK